MVDGHGANEEEYRRRRAEVVSRQKFLSKKLAEIQQDRAQLAALSPLDRLAVLKHKQQLKPSIELQKYNQMRQEIADRLARLKSSAAEAAHVGWGASGFALTNA